MHRDWSVVLNEHQQVAAALTDRGPVLDAIVADLLARLRAGGRVFTLGNGGSAADAQHIAAELLGRYKVERVALPAMALTTDSSTLTAIANDLGYERTFSRQLEGLVRPGDAVWALSTSGNSRNVVCACKLARQQGALVIGFTGAGGGALAEFCDHLFRAPHTSSDRVQEAHALAYHYICERIEAALAGGT
ncbi:MAG: SIS domain-containing protein [Planctomycetota bacterium]